MIIDIHTHIYNNKIYQDYLLKSNHKAKKILVMDEPSIAIKDLLNFASKKNNLYIIGTVDVQENIEKQLKDLEILFQKKKIFGVKLYPGYYHFYPSDKKIYPIAKLCEKYNKPLIFHSGDVYDIKNKAILKYSHPIHIDDLAIKYPQCKIIIAHFGFPYFIETANIVSKNKNVYTDISGTIDNDSYSLGEKKKLFNQYVKDLLRVFAYFPDVKKKVMFGTDYSGENTPLSEIKPYIKFVEHVFSKKEQNSVFYQLANKLFFCKN